MSDGGKVESKRDEGNPVVRGDAEDFGRAMSRIAVAQLCKRIGFASLNESALDSLTDIAIRYLRNLGKIASCYTNLAGRTVSNAFDIIRGLEDLRMSTGFSGALELRNNCVMSSGVMTEIREYLKSAEEIPFAQLIPHFPVVREQRMIPSFLQMVEVPARNHIPEWLPAFPDPHTYIHSPMWYERVSDPRTDKIELARQHRKAERSLSSLQQRLMCNGSAVTLTCEPDNVKNLLEVDDIKNPYIAKPLKAGEKVASPVGLPAKLSGEAHTGKHVLLLEAFAPAIAAMKDGMCDSVSDGEKTLPEKRPGVRLEFKGGKKVFGDSLDLRIQNKDSGRIAAWFGREDEKDDKKSSLYFGNLWKTKKSSLSCKFLVS